jgi:DsbC/DsbD-like thiol-disulfide interchange protein
VQLRLISAGKINPDGKTLIGLELNMPANTKTYWRVPGDTGLLTELDFTGSAGVMGHTIHWPFPTRDHTGDVLDYVYYGPTVLPVELDLAGAAHLELSALLGICSDICIPAQARFSLPLTGAKPDMANTVRLKQAMAKVPIPWPAGQEGFGAVSYEPGDNLLHVSVNTSAIDLSSLIVTTASGEPLLGTPQKSPEPNLVTVPIVAETSEIDWKDQTIQFTFMTDLGAYEATGAVNEPVAEQ